MTARERLYDRARDLTTSEAGASGACRSIQTDEQGSRVVITEEGAPSGDRPGGSEFTRRHPVLSYLFGDMVRGFYVVGCLGLDLFAPVQLRLWFPGQDFLVLPPVIAAVLVLAYGEWRLYRRLWPRPKSHSAVDIAPHLRR